MSLVHLRRPSRASRSPVSRPHRFLAATATGLLVLAGCAPQDDDAASVTSPSAAATASVATTTASTTPAPKTAAPTTAAGTPSSTAAGIPGCTPSDIRTLKPGTLTLATSKPAFEPWMVDDDPTTGKGFESAVAYAAATALGYSRAQVTWTRADFNAAVQPGRKTFDADINQFSITEARRTAVDFSSSYYAVPQAVLVRSDAVPAERTIAALKDLQLGAQVGTTSYQAITGQIRPGKGPRTYNDNSAAGQALGNGQIQAMVADLPTALYLAAAELKGVEVFGQLPPSGATPDQLAFVLDKGSPVTACLTKAVDQLRTDGTLTKLATQWLTASAGAPVLK